MERLLGGGNGRGDAMGLYFNLKCILKSKCWLKKRHLCFGKNIYHLCHPRVQLWALCGASLTGSTHFTDRGSEVHVTSGRQGYEQGLQTVFKIQNIFFRMVFMATAEGSSAFIEVSSHWQGLQLSSLHCLAPLRNAVGAQVFPCHPGQSRAIITFPTRVIFPWLPYQSTWTSQRWKNFNAPRWQIKSNSNRDSPGAGTMGSTLMSPSMLLAPLSPALRKTANLGVLPLLEF